MRNLITIVCLCVGFAMSAQIVNITYVTVPREESDQFLEIHEKFMNLSVSDERTLSGAGVFAHAFAGDYSFALYDFYASTEDLVKDAALADAALEANVDAMNLDEEGKKQMTQDYMTYTRMYADNHSHPFPATKRAFEVNKGRTDVSTSRYERIVKFDKVFVYLCPLVERHDHFFKKLRATHPNSLVWSGLLRAPTNRVFENPRYSEYIYYAR